MVKYKNKLHPWKYIVVLPIARNPIKISSPNLSSLKPVHEGIRRVLLAQQRDRGGSAHPYATPVRDPHAPREAQNGHGRDDYGERERDGYNRGNGDGPQGGSGGYGGQQRPDPFFSGRY